MRIGIDLGGTKMEGIALDSAGREIARKRIPTPTGGYKQTVEAVCDLVLLLESETGQQASIGVGIPGTISPRTGRVLSCCRSSSGLLQQNWSEVGQSGL